MKMWNKFLHTLEACWLCIKFPFLYPRNRFTGRHSSNILRSLLRKLYENSILEISITGKLETDENTLFSNCILKRNLYILLWKDINKLVFSDEKDFKEYDLTSLLSRGNKFKILGLSSYDTYCGNVGIRVHVKTIDESDKTNYGFRYDSVKLIKNEFKYSIYKILRWIDEEILDRILFIPTYTELDAMEPGWRKAFGIQMCKDLKAAAKKDGYKFHIMQLKEKWGFMHLYLDMYGPEVNKVISKYEDLSWNTCFLCGKPATKISAGWVLPYCDDCFPKDGLVYMKKWKDNKYHQVKRKQPSCTKK